MSIALEQTRDRTRPRITVDAYYRMAEMGLIGPDERVELIEGELWPMPPSGPDHAGTSDLCEDRLIAVVPGHMKVRVAKPLRLNDATEFEPDIALVRRRDNSYRSGHPTPADTLLVIEIADTSLARDRTLKLRAYAQAGIPEYWIVDLQARAVDIHRQPRGDAYASVERRAEGDIALAADPGIVVPITGLL